MVSSSDLLIGLGVVVAAFAFSGTARSFGSSSVSQNIISPSPEPVTQIDTKTRKNSILDEIRKLSGQIQSPTPKAATSRSLTAPGLSRSVANALKPGGNLATVSDQNIEAAFGTINRLSLQKTQREEILKNNALVSNQISLLKKEFQSL